jgi:predicted transcriptional regulator
MRNLLVIFFVMLGSGLFAQEFNCEIIINHDRIEGTNKQRFETLQTSLTEFMNSQVWTEFSYEPEERIDLTISIIIMQDLGSDQYSATLQVQSVRPVYGTDYSTPTYNYKDTKFQFKYTEFEPLIYNEQSFSGNLVSTMAFYTYLILGIDEDTFKEMGGTIYFEKARKVVELSQNRGYSGWDPSSNRTNRYWIIENLLSDTYSSARKASYQYHRLGLDNMSKRPKEGKDQVYEAIMTLYKLAQSRPNANIIQNFMDAKTDEIVQVFSGGPQVDIAKLKKALNTISPTSQSNWERLK